MLIARRRGQRRNASNSRLQLKLSGFAGCCRARVGVQGELSDSAFLRSGTSLGAAVCGASSPARSGNVNALQTGSKPFPGRPADTGVEAPVRRFAEDIGTDF